jgi:nucleoid DNA-binding protein
MAKKKAKAKTAAKATKKTAAKAATKKTAAKVASKAKVAPMKKAPTPLNPTTKLRTKSEIMALLADHSGISKKEVSSMFETLAKMIELDLGKKGPGLFTVPGLMKITLKKKPATKARVGVNPFTGEQMTFKAKPARNVVRIRPLKALKDMA